MRQKMVVTHHERASVLSFAFSCGQKVICTIFLKEVFLRHSQTSERCERFQLVKTGIETSPQKMHYISHVEIWVNKTKQGAQKTLQIEHETNS